jgi:deoxyribonuclease-4
MSKIILGAHTSAAGGAPNALYEGESIGATTVQLFTSNQKQWQGRQISNSEIEDWKEALGKTGIESVMSHDSYLINLGSPDSELLAKSRKGFRDELERCHRFGIPLLNFHPGAATDKQEEACLDRIAESLLELEGLPHLGSTLLLLETTAGQGTSVGHRFEHLAYIIDKVKHSIPIAVCIDTCHIFAAGYDIRTREGWEKTLREFDQVIGLKYLRAFHVNDSLKDLGTRVDRHAPLGEGKIGIECFQYLMTDPKTKDQPKYLETPEGPVGWKKEITMLKQFAEQGLSYAH